MTFCGNKHFVAVSLTVHFIYKEVHVNERPQGGNPLSCLRESYFYYSIWNYSNTLENVSLI
jgi:hypothetical protein